MRDEFYNQLKAELEAWHKQQKNQQDGYEYEKSFVELWQRLGRDILQESMEELPKSRNQKKD